MPEVSVAGFLTAAIINRSITSQFHFTGSKHLTHLRVTIYPASTMSIDNRHMCKLRTKIQQMWTGLYVRLQ